MRGIVYDGILFERHPGGGFYSKLHQNVNPSSYITSISAAQCSILEKM